MSILNIFNSLKLISSIPSFNNQSLNLPIVGFGYNNSLYNQLNNHRVGATSGIGIISGSQFPGQAAVDASLITLATSNPPNGFGVGWSTFDPINATRYLNDPNYEVKQFCGCANHDPTKLTGHSWVYVVYPRTGVQRPDDWDFTGSLQGEPPQPSGRLPPPDLIIGPPPPVIGANVSFTYTANPIVATFFDVALELRGNTYCAANNTRDSGKRWIPATPPQTETWDHAFFSIFQNRFGAMSSGSALTNLLRSNYFSLQNDPSRPNPYMVINGDEGEGLLRQVPDATRVTYNIYTDLPDNNFVPLNYLVTECREGCKTINVIPVPLPNELPENQKYEVIDDYFDAYHYIFVRNFQSKNVGDLFSDKIRWDEVGINNKILYSNAKLNDFLQRYVPLTATTLPYEINFGSRRFRRYYDYDQSKINLAFFIDFSVCDGYIGEHWYGQTSPFGLETPAKRSIYFVNGVEIEIEGAVRYNRPSVQYQLWRNYNRYWASIVGFLGVAEETMIYAIRRRFPYKIKIPKHHLPNGYEFKIFPKLANFFFDPNGNENNFAAYPTIFDVTGMAFDKDTRKTTYGQPLIPGAAYTQSNFTFPACYKIAQQPINLPTNTNGSIRVYNYPNPTSPATTVDDVIEVSIGANPPEYSFFSFSQNDLDEQGNPTKAYYKKTTSAPINQTVGVIQHPQNNGKNEFGAYRP